MTVHRTLNGNWAECADLACDLKFHVPDLSVTEAQKLPLHVLLPLLEIIDPPTGKGVMFGSKMWTVVSNGQTIRHRDYDLPAVIHPNGTMEWWSGGLRNRRLPLPAIIYPDGRTEQWSRGQRVIGKQGSAYLLENKVGRPGKR